MKGKEWAERLAKALEKYKYVLLVAAVGVVLLLWPTGDGGGTKETAEVLQTGLFETGELEEKLEKALSQVEGAGEVTVVLTLEGGPRQVVARDTSSKWSGEETQEESTVVLADQGSGSERAVELQQLSPGYRGALVVSPGAGQPQVRLALTQAVSALTGLGADRISVCKGG